MAQNEITQQTYSSTTQRFLPNPEKIKRYSPVNYTFMQVIHEMGPLPYASILLGLAHDHYPLLMDLNDPRTGSLLIFGDAQCGKTELIISILKSACLTSPDLISINIIANENYTAQEFGLSSTNIEIARPYQPESNQIINKLMLLAKRRLSNHSVYPYIFFGIDDIDSLLLYTDLDTIQQLQWLLCYAPQAHIYPICSATPYILRKDLRFSLSISLFSTILWGHIKDKSLAQNLSKDKLGMIPNLDAGNEFCTYIDKEWLQFYLVHAPKTESQMGINNFSIHGDSSISFSSWRSL